MRTSPFFLSEGNRAAALQMAGVASLPELAVLDEFILLNRLALFWGKPHAFDPCLGGRRPRGLHISSALRSVWLHMSQELLSTLSHLDFADYRRRVRASIALLISWAAGTVGSSFRRSSAVLSLLTAIRALAGLLDLIAQIFRPSVKPYFLLLARTLMPDLHKALADC